MLSGLFYPVTAPPFVAPTVSIITAGYDAVKRRIGDDPEVDKRWVNGVAYQGENNGSLHIADPCSFASDRVGLEVQHAVSEWAPYIITAEDRCPPFGFSTHDYKGRVTRRLENGTPKALELELWTGAAAQATPPVDPQPQGQPALNTNIWLAHPRAVLLNPIAGTAVTMKRAFELLEQAIADSGIGTQGMIHCRPEAMPYIVTMRRDGNIIRTLRDTIVVPGVGYANTAPTGATSAAGTTWLYATGLVEWWLGGPDTYVYSPEGLGSGAEANTWIGKAIDRTNNDVVVRVHRPGMATWDGLCHYAVQATLDT